MDQLMGKLTKEDARNKRLTKFFLVLYLVMIPIYTILFVAPYFFVPEEVFLSSERISGFCYVLSFIAFALIFRYQNKEYSSIDYSLPTVEMLQNVVKRYTLWRPYLWTVLFPIVLTDIGISISSAKNLNSVEATNSILIIQAILIPSFTFSFLIGVLIWRKRQKPLRDNALRLLEELNS